MVQKGSRVTPIYDIHGNLPALEAVLAELESVTPDLIVVGGDVVAGPMPTEVMDRLVTLGERICFVRGNADREVVAAYDDRPHADTIDVADPAEHVAAYAASKIDREHRDLLASFAEHLIMEIEGLVGDSESLWALTHQSMRLTLPGGIMLMLLTPWKRRLARGGGGRLCR
jgi:hypothetical protein